MSDQTPDSTNSDMSWIDIAVLGQKRGVVVVDYATGWSDFIDELHFADVFENKEPDRLDPGVYRWSGFTVGSWHEGDLCVVKGGTFTRAAPPAMDREAVLEALELADATLRGANMDRAFVERKVTAAITGLKSTSTVPADTMIILHALLTEYAGQPNQAGEAYKLVDATLSADAIRQGEGDCGPNGVASVQVETIATAVMRWGAPHFKHMVAFSTLCEAIGHSVDTTFADTNGGLRQALDALRAERAKPVQGPEHGAWDRGRRYGLDDAIRIVASLEGCPATPASHASDGGKA